MRYPRAVSPLSYESVAPSSTDEVYETDTSSDEESEQRHAKRRRIEEYGTRYLQGFPVYIMTAHLKGPFDGSWRNPWKHRSRPSYEQNIATSTVEKQDPAVPETVWRNVDQSEATEVTKQDGRDKPMLPPETNRKSHPRSHLHPPEKSWLRKDRALRSSDTESSQRSPSPVRGHDKQTPITHYAEDTLANTSVLFRQTKDRSCEKVGAQGAAMDCNDDNHLPTGVILPMAAVLERRKTDPGEGDGFVSHGKTTAVQQNLVRSRKPRHMDFASSPVLATKPVEPSSAEKNASRSLPQQDRIENEVEALPLDAALPLEVTINLPSSNKDIAVGPGHDSAVNSDSNVSRHAGESLEQPRKGQAQEKQLQLRGSNVGDQPDTVAAASNVVHSAQIVPQFAIQVNSDLTPSIAPIHTAELAHSDPNMFHEAQSDVALVDDSILGLSTQAAVAKVQENLRAGLTSTDSPPRVVSAGVSSSDGGERSRDGIKLFRSLNTPTSIPLREGDHNRSYEHADTQAMLGAITPFALATVRAKPTAQPLGDSPVRASKPRERKRASFAPTSQDSASSTRSIKSCLKVTKSMQDAKNEAIGKGLRTETDRPEPLLSNHFNPGMRGNADLSSNKQPGDHLRQALPINSHPNGLPTSSTAPFSNSNTTHGSQVQHEAQPMADQVGMGKDDLVDFDLSATIDDIGSFLQSWDPEKEMRNLSTTRA